MLAFISGGKCSMLCWTASTLWRGIDHSCLGLFYPNSLWNLRTPLLTGSTYQHIISPFLFDAIYSDCWNWKYWHLFAAKRISRSFWRNSRLMWRTRTANLCALPFEPLVAWLMLQWMALHSQTAIPPLHCSWTALTTPPRWPTPAWKASCTCWSVVGSFFRFRIHAF